MTVGPHVKLVTARDDNAIRYLWKRGFDTLDIARKLSLHEWQVANRLIHIRWQAASRPIHTRPLRSERPASIVSQISGDPPPGRSALDQKART